MQKDLISWTDIYALCRRSKGKIFAATLFVSLLLSFYALTRPVLYKSEATFREKSKTQTDTARSFSMALLAGIAESNENSAVSALKSRTLLERAILERNFQADIEPDVLFSTQPLNNILNHLKLEYALALNWLTPIVNDNLPPLRATEILYEAEIPLILHVSFTTSEDFRVEGNGFETQGRLEELLVGPGFALKLDRQGTQNLLNQRFKVTLLPLQVVVERVRKRLTVETDLRDKGMLSLSFKNPNRKEASAFLNALLTVYQEHLKSEHQRICAEQIAYLHERQEDASKELKYMLGKHADNLSKNMVTMDLLLQNQQNYAQKLLSIDLELARLATLQAEEIPFYERLGWEGGDMSFISQTLKEIRSYRQQSDAIDIALRNHPAKDPALQKKNFDAQLQELADVRAYTSEAKALQAALKSGKALPKGERLSQNPKYLIQDWQHLLQDQIVAYREAPTAEKKSLRETFDCCRADFNNYVGQLIHVLEVEGKITQERLTHQQMGSKEFQGIDLATANQLYLNYSKSVNELEADILHHTFLLNQMQDPLFEISALSTVLQDPISRDIVAKASQLTLLLKDRDNRTQREIERAQAELALQRTFLIQHVKQTQELLILRKGLFQDKMYSLQNTTLELIQQMISVLHQQIEDYVKSRRDNLEQERLSIAKQQGILKGEMASLPEKWASEKMIEQHLEMTKKMIEKITEAVETKNIASNLDLSQSAPIDTAFPSVHPQRSKFLLLGVLGALIGAFGMTAWVLGQAMQNGIPASSDNLHSLQRHFIGNLKNGVETLRRIATQLTPCSRALLLISSGPNYAPELAQLIGKAGRKTLIIPISFDTPHTTPGLMEYLEGQLDQVKITSRIGFDFLEPGNASPHAPELIRTPRFEKLLDQLQAQYSCILLVSRAPPTSSEGLQALSLAPCAILTLTNETLPQLRSLPTPPQIHFLFN